MPRVNDLFVVTGRVVPAALVLLLLVTLADLGGNTPPAAASHGGLWHTIERVSVASDGTQGNATVRGVSGDLVGISEDGRFVVFGSDASNLVPGDTNGAADIFVRDRLTGTTTRVSVASDGTQANGHSGVPDISRDGRFVVFCSFASNLVPGDTNGVEDAFVHDRHTGKTIRVSVASDGSEGNGPSCWFDDGKYPAGTPSFWFVWSPGISADGRFIAFDSLASNLVPGDTNGRGDVFVHDRDPDGNGIFDDEPDATATTRVSVASDGSQGNGHSFRPNLSADGRFVAFESVASNLAPGGGGNAVYVHDRVTGETTLVAGGTSGTTGSITDDGQLVSFHSWNAPAPPQVFVHDRQTGATTQVSVNSDGVQANSGAVGGRMSADGRLVIFGSAATNLVPDDTNGVGDAFVHDRLTGETHRVSVAHDGSEGNGGSGAVAISADGRFVVFISEATNLVPGDTNGTWDVFVAAREEAPPPTPLPAPSDLTCTPRPAGPPCVGGTVELLAGGTDASAQRAAVASAPLVPYAAIAGLAAAGAVALLAGGWYARRRWLR